MKTITTITTAALLVLATTLSKAQSTIKAIKSGNWSDSTVWNTGTLPTANDKVFIVNLSQLTMDNNVVDCNGLNIDSGSVFNAYNSGTINVSGDWNNSGTFTDNGSTVTFNGTSKQIISGKTNTFYNITINNPVDVSLWGSVSLINELQLTSGKLLTNGLPFTLLSDANKTARIAPINISNASLVGNITMQRYINNTQGTWRYFGSAVIGDTVGDLTNSFPTYGFIGATYPNAFFSSVQYYDETVAGPSNTGYNYISNENQMLVNGLGYNCWIDSGAYVVSVTGQPAVGNQTFNVTNTANTDTASDGWNLIANPYPSAIDWNSANWNKSGIDNAIYVWDSNLQQYAAYINGISTNGGSSIIPSSEAFMVHASLNNPSLSCDENVKVANNGTFLKTVDPNLPMSSIKFGLSGGIYSDETVINFADSALQTYDKKEDAIKLFTLNSKAPSISSFEDNYDLAINSLPKNALEQNIPIRVLVGVPGTYVIKPVLNMFVKQFSCMILEDLVTKAKIDITTNATYSFNISDTTKAPRFVLHLSSPVATSTISPLKTISIEPTCSYKKNGKGVVRVGKSIGSVTYTWKTISGSTLAVHSNSFGSDTLQNIGAGKYIVSVSGIASACGVTLPIGIDTIVINPNRIQVSSIVSNENSETAAINPEVLKGGKAPFKFSWSNNEVNTNTKTLSNGTYTLYTIDSNGCVDTSLHVVNNEKRQQESFDKNSSAPRKIKFTVFPNPNSGEFTVDMSGLENGHDVKITLRDEKGSNVYESSFNLQDDSSVQRKIVPETKLNNGVYFCTLMVEGIEQTVKVIIQ